MDFLFIDKQIGFLPRGRETCVKINKENSEFLIDDRVFT